MKLDLNLDSTKLLEKKFSANLKGYDPDEVDEFLDQILADYRRVEQLDKEIDHLSVDNGNLKKIQQERDEWKAKYDILDEKLKVLDKNRNAALDRLELLVKVNRLENALFKLGVDPTKIK